MLGSLSQPLTICSCLRPKLAHHSSHTAASSFSQLGERTITPNLVRTLAPPLTLHWGSLRAHELHSLGRGALLPPPAMRGHSAMPRGYRVPLGEAACTRQATPAGPFGTRPLGLRAARIDWNASPLPSLMAWLFALPARATTTALPSLLGTLAGGLATTTPVSSITHAHPQASDDSPLSNPVDNMRA